MATIAEYVIADIRDKATPDLAEVPLRRLRGAGRERDLRVAALAIRRAVELVDVEQEDADGFGLDPEVVVRNLQAALRDVADALDRAAGGPVLVRDDG